MAEVINFPGSFQVTTEDTDIPDLPLDSVLEGARENDLHSIIIVGLDQEDNLYIASQSNNIAKTLFFLERAKMALLGYE